MRLTGRQVSQGELMPKWYGLAIYEPWSDTQICYPIPLNLLYRWYDALRWKVKRGKDTALHVAWSSGYNEGRQIMYDVGFDAGVEHGKKIQADELRAAFKTKFGYDFMLLPTGDPTP